jgi:hypothetical protein
MSVSQSIHWQCSTERGVEHHFPPQLHYCPTEQAKKKNTRLFEKESNLHKKYQPENVTNHKNSQTLICIILAKKNFESPGGTGLAARS